MKRKARIARCYTEQPLTISTEIELDKRSSHHLSTVLRARIGTAVELFNGDGKNYSGEIIATGKKTLVNISNITDSEIESPLKITLIQAIARGDKMDGIVQKATELGANEIQPVYTQNAIAKLDAKRETRKQAHWQSIVISACEQCGRCIVPYVHPPLTLAQVFDEMEPLVNNDQALNQSLEQRWILSPIAQGTTMGDTSITSAVLLVGPESGFEESELLASKAAGFSELQLGPRVLRTETAGPAAIAVLQARFGDLNLHR